MAKRRKSRRSRRSRGLGSLSMTAVERSYRSRSRGLFGLSYWQGVALAAAAYVLWKKSQGATPSLAGFMDDVKRLVPRVASPPRLTPGIIGRAVRLPASQTFRWKVR